MNQKMIDAYKAERAASPYRPAQHVLAGLKETARQQRLLLDWSLGAWGDMQESERDGLRVTVEIKSDDDGAYFERDRFDPIARDDVPESVWEHSGSCDRSERETVRYTRLGRGGGWHRWNPGNGTFADLRAFYSAQGGARNEAYRLAMANMESQFESDEKAMEDYWFGVIVTVADAHTGEELAEDSCWGFQEGSELYAITSILEDALSAAESALETRTHFPVMEAADA